MWGLMKHKTIYDTFQNDFQCHFSWVVKDESQMNSCILYQSSRSVNFKAKLKETMGQDARSGCHHANKIFSTNPAKLTAH